MSAAGWVSIFMEIGKRVERADGGHRTVLWANGIGVQLARVMRATGTKSVYYRSMGDFVVYIDG